MKFYLCVLCFFYSTLAFSWGRHDIITQIALDQSDFSFLEKTHVAQESIENAAPDLLARVVPDLLKWCERYHRDYDYRYDWKIPASLPPTESHLSAREKLLWALEDNMNTRLKLGDERTAAEILVYYVDEPDGHLDSGLGESPYIERVGESMSYFGGGNDANTHAFRHYFVPSSLIPPVLGPKGIAPYRAALYARLSEGAFNTGHPYWGYRFLAWSIHYTQDVTQPWHTIFLPGLSFFSFSKSQMKHEVSSLHYLTEAFADAWMQRGRSKEGTSSEIALPSQGKSSGPWFVAEVTEALARQAHAKALRVAIEARSLFKPIVESLDRDLKPNRPEIMLGGLKLASVRLDFDGDGRGATLFLAPLWQSGFKDVKARDELLKDLVTQLNSAIGGSRLVLAHVLRSTSQHPTEGTVVGFPS